MRRGVALAGAALALGCFVGPAAASTITWSAPSLIDQRLPFAVSQGIGDLACPSTHLCVGTQARGVEISRNPLGGARTWAITSLPVTPGFPLGPISCASPRLCVAANDRGQVLTSTNPTGGARAWTSSQVASFGQVTALSCPRVHFCIGLLGNNIVVSANPTRPRSWRVVNVTDRGRIDSVACPSSSLCVGTVGTAGYAAILTTTSPTGPGYDWNVLPETDNSINFFADPRVACPSAHLCVVTDAGGNILTSTDPALQRWKRGRLSGADPHDLSCPLVHLCVAVGPSTVAVSTNPAGGARTWRVTPQPTQYPEIAGLSCVSASLCAATQGDLVLSTSHPARGAAGWSSSYLRQGYNPLTAISCPSDQLCVGIEAGGNLVTSSAPAASAGAWNVAPLTIGAQTVLLSTLSCPSVSFCAGTTSSGALATSDDPSDPHAWSLSPALAWSSTARGLEDVSCPSASFCVGPDGVGAIHVSDNPSGGTSAWSSQQLGTPLQCERQYCNYDPLIAVSCSSTNLCATTDGNYLWTSTNPDAASATWTKSELPVRPSKLFCPTDSLCLVASGATLEATMDPSDPSPQWTTMNLPKLAIPASFGPAFAPYISSISCVSAQLCVATDIQGGYAFVGNPADPGSWTATKLDYSSPVPVLSPGSLTGVSCLPSGRCLAVDGSGHVLVGTASG